MGLTFGECTTRIGEYTDKPEGVWMAKARCLGYAPEGEAPEKVAYELELAKKLLAKNGMAPP